LVVEPEERYERKHIRVFGKMLSYVDEGRGDPILFIHGNPGSSFVWRNILPFLTRYGRCIAPDLIGMGQSEKLTPSGDRTYRFDDLQYYLDALLNLLGAGRNLTLVVHEYGSLLGFDWARRHPLDVRGLAYMESIIRPLSWDEWPERTRALVRGLRGPEGPELALAENQVVERLLPDTIQRTLAPREMEAYRRPYRFAGEGRRPTLSCIRDLPIGKEPLAMVAVAEANAEWLGATDTPKLFVNCEPGYLLVGTQREDCRRFDRQAEITVPALHYPQEDSPMALASELAAWYRSL
jgi:haloalkane dehalogenase